MEKEGFIRNAPISHLQNVSSVVITPGCKVFVVNDKFTMTITTEIREQKTKRSDIEIIYTTVRYNLFVTKTKMSNDEIVQYFRHYYANGNNLRKAIYTKVLTDEDGLKNHQITLGSHSDNVEQYMESYFSPNKDLIWRLASNTNRDIKGMNMSMHLLLHGPPGTGKSTLAYRLSRALKRSLVSVDILSLKTKRDLYKIIQTPFNNDANLCIVLLEEFDKTLKYLIEEKKRESMRDEKSVEKDTRDYGIDDLLEVLGGPVPVPGSIIIATSNDYEGLIHMCPPLFREGRLTPVYCGYITQTTLEEMTLYYFEKPLRATVIKDNIPPVDIIAIAKDCLLKGGYNKFITMLTKKKLIVRQKFV